ncbi:uracil-DNA glycosylase [Candidatus Micrarchaeota archaeon]|nr:uracil-DNA glycosylase [Candidatus Micrarchaeota archaeon]
MDPEDYDNHQKQEMELLIEQINKCTKCPLYKTRHRTVPGEFNYNADILFIGEAPGRMEDMTGHPFCGPSGKILTDWINYLGLTRKDVFITSVLKCRPPNNRNPRPEEINACKPYMDKQIDIIKPKFIIALGKFAIAYLKDKYNIKIDNSSMRKIVGKMIEIKRNSLFGRQDIIIVPFYHPAYQIYNRSIEPEIKRMLDDIKERLKSVHK